MPCSAATGRGPASSRGCSRWSRAAAPRSCARVGTMAELPEPRDGGERRDPAAPSASPPLFADPHRRYDPLRDEWVLVSPGRTNRPWQGGEERPQVEVRPAYDPTCYLCPGNTRANGETNPAYETTF